MEYLYMILDRAIKLGATDIHLAKDVLPVYRINKKLEFDDTKMPLSEQVLLQTLESFYSVIYGLEDVFKEKKQADFAYTYMNTRFRINVSLSKGVPTFSIRVIPNGTIDLDELGIRDMIEKMKTIESGLILVTGKINSGKTTTLNAFIQEVNKEQSKKIVTLEDPVEYEHKSDKSIIVQKDIGRELDVLTFNDGLINLLREDADISVVGEIRDRKTMDVAMELAELGGIVIGTLHTRSCGETVERILTMHDPAEQNAIKNTLSSVLKLVVSQKLLVGKDDKLVLVPEIMVVDNVLAAHIRQEKFSIADIEDAIHTQRETGCISYEYSFSKLYLEDKIDMEAIKNNLTKERLDIVKSIITTQGNRFNY